MEHHINLYNDLRSQTPHHKRINRELQEANRNKQRRDRFQNSRNISVSPVRHKQIIIPLCPEGKENETQEENRNSTRLAKLVCNTNNPEKLTKQEEFLKRFVEWMDKKKNMKKEKEGTNKKKPFISAVNSGNKPAASSSLVPRGHHEGFRPPVLKNPIEKGKADETKPDVKGRQSIYTVVPTPPRKTKESDEKLKKKFPIARKALPTNLHTKILNSNKTPKVAAKNLQTKHVSSNIIPNVAATSLTRAGSKLNHKTPVDNQKPTVRKSSATKSALESKTKIATATMPPPPVRSKLKPRVLKMPPPPKSAAQKALEIKKSEDASNKAKGQTVAAKLRDMNSKRLENVKQTKKSPLKRLAQNLKAKKPLNTTNKINVPNVQVNGKQIINLLKSKNQDMVIQTPKDFTLNPFEEFVTSTKLRNSSQNMDNLQGEEGIESSPKREPVVKKFNFLRYSEAADNDHNDSDDLEGKVELDGENKILVPATAIEEKTPTKSGPEERPANYLSPFVSVTRGKVSLKREKEKRNSVYLQSPAADNVELPTECNSPNKSPKYSVEVRRTLEAVRYFRKQLQNETDRLLQLCDVWETYKNENLEKIQNANGEDMINVTIGQSRLLTSKKFMQFKGLIDRCEAGATGIGDVENDGSEATKPINSVDLEGFWSMLGLQVDNLEKRFDNLNRWKLNNWLDPDEVKSKPKKNLTKVKKAKAAPAAKAKPNSALQQMLRKMQAEMRKNKNKNDEINGDVVLTPTKQKQRRSANSNNSTPRKSLDSSSTRRLSIVVKDRKYFSPAATVISVSSPNRRLSILQRKSSQDSPKMLKHIEKFHEALGNIQSPFNLRKSVLMNGNPRRMSCNPQSPLVALDTVAVNCDNDDVATSSHMVMSTESPQRSPVPTGRKSILKTPGTAKSRLRNVIFNEKLRVKKFNFLLNEDDSLNGANDANDSHEEDLAQREDEPQRTLTLRNRKVRLRPSCEIVIPSSLPPK